MRTCGLEHYITKGVQIQTAANFVSANIIIHQMGIFKNFFFSHSFFFSLTFSFLLSISFLLGLLLLLFFSSSRDTLAFTARM